MYILPTIFKQEGCDRTEGKIFPHRKNNVCYVSFIQVSVKGLLAVNPMLKNQQYVLNKIF